MIDLDHLMSMAHSPIRNYGVPGLTSWLIGMPSASGVVRLFVCGHSHQMPITPHSHRFDFQCHVLRGRVINRIWRKDGGGSEYEASTLVYLGYPGKYDVVPGEVACWKYDDHEYVARDSYSMTADQIHSIYFEKNAHVLFLEGPSKTKESLILQPYCYGKCVPTFKVDDWMFDAHHDPAES